MKTYVVELVKRYLETLGWKVLPHASHSPDVTSSDYYLFPSMSWDLADQHFSSYDDVNNNWLDSWIATKDMQFLRRGIDMLPER